MRFAMCCEKLCQRMMHGVAMSSELERVEASLRGEIKSVEASLRGEIKSVEASLEGRMVALEGQMASLRLVMLAGFGFLGNFLWGLALLDFWTKFVMLEEARREISCD